MKLSEKVQQLEIELEVYKQFHEVYNEYRREKNPDASKYTETEENVFTFQCNSEDDAHVSKFANEIIHGHPTRSEEVDGVWYSHVDIGPAIRRVADGYREADNDE